MAIRLDGRIQYNANSRLPLKDSKQNTSFTGIGEFVTGALVASDKVPMVGISIIDLTSMIIPRTAIDATRNGFAATETFFRESSGLIINCLTPGYVVLGVAKLAQNMIMGKEFNKLNAHKIWANQSSIDTLADAWLHTRGKREQRVFDYVKNVFDNVQGLTGNNEYTKLKDVVQNPDDYYKRIADCILDNKQVDEVADDLIKQFGASKNIKLISNVPLKKNTPLTEIKIDCSFKELTRDVSDLGKRFVKISNNRLPDFTHRLTKLVNKKSLFGLGVIMSVASVVQWANRQITKKRSGCDGFVGDPSFGKGCDKNKKAPSKKSSFMFKKTLGAAAMGALALASFGKLKSFKMFQFNGKFPTMNQMRLISASTFVGRIMASEDENELRETTLRDMFGFANLYLLGDYVSKGCASLMEKFNPEVKGKLLYQTKKLEEGASPFKKAMHWITNTELKAFDEVPEKLISSRGISQAAGIIYSCFALGIAIPLWNKYSTEKKAKQKEQNSDSSKIDNINMTNETHLNPTMTGRDLISNEAKEVYSAFLK